MELMPGYKQSDVGVIPDDWDAKPLGEIGDSLIGLTYRPSEVRKYGTLVLRSSNVQNGTLCFDDNVFVDANIPDRIMVRPGDILVCVRNGSRDLIGKSALIDERAVGMTFGAFMGVFRSEYGQFLHHVFQSGIFKKQINEHLGATINQITNKSLNSFKVPLPPTDEERTEIARALSDVDALLTSLDQVIAKKRDVKQATMQQLLTGETRLRGFSGEWKVKRLGEAIERIVGGGTPSRANNNYWNGSIPWVTVKDFSTFNTQQAQEYITDAGLKNSASNLIPAGTLITSTRMALGKAVIYHVDVTINQDLKALFLKPNQDVQFMRYWFEQNSMMIDSIGGGSTVKGISIRQLQAFEFNSPPTKEEQTAIATLLTDMDAELSMLEYRRDKTHNLKQAMMQELLTGKTRLV